MIRPWMPLYVGDYIADTAHLTAAESGAYLHLIMHYWMKGGLPSDEAILMRIARLSPEEWAKSRDTLREFFQDGWKHKRVEFELTEALRISKAGQKGGIASGEARKKIKKEQEHRTIVERSLNDRGNDSPTICEALQPQRKKEIEIPKKESLSCAVADATRTTQNEKFEEFWKAYPKRNGANPKAPARKLFLGFVKAGIAPEAIIAGAAECARRDSDKVGTPYIPQAVKWLRDRRWDDYRPPPQQPQAMAQIGFYADFASSELEAWDKYGKRTGRSYPRDKRGGWTFPTRWPPGHGNSVEPAAGQSESVCR